MVADEMRRFFSTGKALSAKARRAWRFADRITIVGPCTSLIAAFSAKGQRACA
jgi:hypothetical protein